MPRRVPLGIVLLALLALLVFPVRAERPAGAPQAAPVDPTTVSGVLNIAWGDPHPASGLAPRMEFNLHTDDGRDLRLDVSAIADRDRLVQLDRQRVRAVLRAGVAKGQAAGTTPRVAISSIDAEAPPSGQASKGEAAVTGNKKWISLPCKFADVGTEPKNLAFLQGEYALTYPGLGLYWREVSYDVMNIDGSTAINWVTLPQARSYYVYDIDLDGQPELDFTRATTDCTRAADPYVDFSQYVGINMMFNGDLDGSSWGGSRSLNLDGVSRTFMTTWLAPWGYTNLSPLAHEMGHGFGMPHSSGTYGQVYDNQWDVMSDTWSLCSGAGRDAVYACLPQHPGAYQKSRLGWIGPAQRASVATGGQATVTLERLAQPTNSNPLLLESAPANGIHYTVEARRRIGYDAYLPADAVIVHRITDSNGAIAIIDTDTDGSTKNAGWLPGTTYFDGANNIFITVDSMTASGFVVTLWDSAPAHTLTVTKSGAGSGTVTSTPAGISCGSTCTSSLPADITVRLAAAPASSSYFAGWGGDCAVDGTVALTADRSCSVRFERLTLPMALDTAYLPWTAPGNVPWFPQSAVSHDGVDAAQSGAIGPGQTSSLQRTFVGPGTLAFWWRIDSTYGTLTLYRNDVQVTSITGASGWVRWTVGLGSGLQTLRWTFTKLGPAASGADAAWVDEVSGPTTTFSDDPLQPRVTIVKAAHVNELRQQVAQLRTRYGLGAFAWTDTSLVAGSTPVRAAHVVELRSALDAVYATLSLPAPAWTPSAIVGGQAVIAAAQIAEIRAAVVAVW